MKILIVDDSLIDHKIVISSIQMAGIKNEVLQASNGEQGLEILRQNFKDICLILLDWEMPRMNGIEFMKVVKKVPQVASIPIILITASGSDEHKKIAKEANPNLAGYLVKPYSKDKLVELVKSFLK